MDPARPRVGACLVLGACLAFVVALSLLSASCLVLLMDPARLSVCLGSGRRLLWSYHVDPARPRVGACLGLGNRLACVVGLSRLLEWLVFDGVPDLWDVVVSVRVVPLDVFAGQSTLLDVLGLLPCEVY